MSNRQNLQRLRQAIESGDWRHYHGDLFTDILYLLEMYDTLQIMPDLDFKREMEWVEKVGTSNPHVVSTLRRMVMTIDMKVQPIRGYMEND